jgi:3-hydroxyisobutyrate dehydrogenase-like beta-hydroxyacid dehydrogenase
MRTPFGFLGLGRMGAPMATRLVAAGFDVTAHDVAGTAERLPDGARRADTLAGVTAAAEIVLLSLPDGPAVREAATAITGEPGRCRAVVDLSTIGIEAAQEVATTLRKAGIAYLDAPVSGGVSGAVAGTLAVMAAGPKALFDEVESGLNEIGGNVFHLGEKPGQGQAMKLLNNFLSATAMAATAEAVVFGESLGLDLGTMLRVLNVSSGQNTATSDKFPKRVLTGTFDAGFATRLMTKDVALYRKAVARQGTARELADAVGGVWDRCDAARPDSDFTEIYADRGGANAR